MTTVSFDQAVAYYDNTRGYPLGVPEKIRDAIIHFTHATPSTQYLELGVGTGLIALPFLATAAHYVGVDISAQMLYRLQAKLAPSATRPAPLVQAPLVQADVTRALPFPTHSFDVVTAFRVLHVLDRWQSALAEAMRLLRPKGYLIIGGDTQVDQPNQASPAAVVHSKWDEILASLGIAEGEIRPGLWLSNQTIADFLQHRGATTQTVDLVDYTSTPLSVRMMAERHKQRMYSRDWEIPAAIHAQAVNVLDNWIEHEYVAPDEKIAQPMVFRALIARWDQ